MQRFSYGSKMSKVSSLTQTSISTKTNDKTKDNYLCNTVSLKHLGKSISQTINNINKQIQLTNKDKKRINKMKSEDNQYQNLLILEHELDLKILEQEETKKIIGNNILESNTSVLKLKDQIQKFKLNMYKKSIYIYNFGEHLTKKFSQKKLWRTKKNTLQIKTQQNLLQKTLSIKEQSLISQINQQIAQVQAIINEHNQYTNDLMNQFRVKQQQVLKIQERRQTRRRTIQRKKSISRIRQQYKKSNKQKQIILKHKSQYQCLNKNLSFLLTLEQQHQNSCIIIQKAFLQKQLQKVISYSFQVQTAKQYETNLIPNLQQMILQTHEQIDELKRKISKREQMLKQFTINLQCLTQLLYQQFD